MKGVAMSSVSIDIDMAVYGFANARYYPALMQRPHRHNEVEMNFIEQGAITYLFGGARVTVNAGQIALFWATIPHQLILIEERTVLNWVTVPFATFLQWQLPDVLTRQVICGKFLIDAGEAGSFEANRAIFRQWYTDLQRESPEYRRIVLLEVEARLRRLALTMNAHEDRLEEAAEQHHNGALPPANEPSNVERMACFIAEHYTEPLNVEKAHRVVRMQMYGLRYLFDVERFGIVLGNKACHTLDIAGFVGRGERAIMVLFRGLLQPILVRIHRQCQATQARLDFQQDYSAILRRLALEVGVPLAEDGAVGLEAACLSRIDQEFAANYLARQHIGQLPLQECGERHRDPVQDGALFDQDELVGNGGPEEGYLARVDGDACAAE